ncbi:hypothetical protein HUJ04_004303 [Dendroctonus ponderosae]|nr:hypothetical protein HUJ04_004303 [Dendroctonus ponderosae]
MNGNGIAIKQAPNSHTPVKHNWKVSLFPSTININSPYLNTYSSGIPVHPLLFGRLTSSITSFSFVQAVAILKLLQRGDLESLAIGENFSASSYSHDWAVFSLLSIYYTCIFAAFLRRKESIELEKHAWEIFVFGRRVKSPEEGWTLCMCDIVKDFKC